MKSENPYQGDSPPKKFSRLFFWLKAREVLGTQRFVAGTYLVLASHEAGDVSVLRALGIPLKNITAVDWDKDAAAAARSKFPGLNVICQDVESVALEHKGPKFTAVFLDFCAQLTLDHLQKVMTVAEHVVEDKGLLGCGFQVGREKTTKEAVMELKTEFEREIAKLPPESYLLWDGTESYLARAIYLRRSLDTRAKAKGLQIAPCAFFFYRSRTTVKQGQPMCEYLAQMGVKAKGEPQIHFYQPDEEELRSYALDLEERTKAAGLLLNIPKSSIAAWKAHKTRGTYK